MRSRRSAIAVTVLLSTFAAVAMFVGAGCCPPPPPAGVTAGEVTDVLDQRFNTVDRNLTLWDIQPGLGTVMIEYGKRFFMIQKAVEAGDFGMAQYQLIEQIEIQEVGETTRPARADALKAFEQAFLDPIAADIQNKDTASFNTHFTAAIGGCNACHAATEHAYVVVQPATRVPEGNLLLAASDPVAPPTPSTFTSPTLPFTPDQVLTGDQVNELIDFFFNTVDRNLALWNIQPGLGTVMIEYGLRFAMIKLAADVQSWGMAQYQLKEQIEIQEVGETTRPANATLLKNFEQSFLDPLSTAINNQDANAFTTAYANAITGCNQCHVATGHSYVRVMLPSFSPEPILTLSASSVQPEVTPSTFPPNPPTIPETPTLEDATAAVDFRFNNLDRNLALWNIQPGLGTVMIEYGYRFDQAWFSGEAGNWPMVSYQVEEMTEIQEVGEVTRPARADALKNFEQAFLTPLQNAATAQDKTAFESAYSAAVTGCNACHAATGFPFVVAHVPTEPYSDYLKP